MGNEYLIISPCRNEEKYMRKTLESVVNQTITPAKWLIVDDGSTDNTPQILREYADKYDFIEILTRKNRGHRAVGPGVIEAFYDGYNQLNIDDYSYICKLDLDLDLPYGYFEFLINQMVQEPRLGTYSGKPYFIDDKSGELIPEVCGDESSVGMTKFYRVECFKQIGGFVRQVMWDGIDSHRCRLLGWISASEDHPEIRFTHLRPMGSSQKSIWTGRIRHGFGQYFMGTGFLYMFASVVFRLNKKPYVIGSIATFWGYVKSAFTNVQRLDDPEMIKLMKQFHWACLTKGKVKAAKEFNQKRAAYWNPNNPGYSMPNKEV
ncbi:glycosyltransferase [Pseudoalteromonas sp. SSM20]|uniref:glycosyltransferase n=1 Tax=Pseudoalteromonas sp. SSM20 TaxID=3139394 RepID=UPI003BA9A360